MTLDAAETVLGFFGFDRTAFIAITKWERNGDGMKKYGNKE